jgi:hypothetical protein
MITDDSGSYTRVMMHEYYNQENIDVLFSGASLCYRSFDPKIIDEEINANTFNLGSSSQDIDASYYLIKDAIARYNLDSVYLELSPIMALNMNIEERNPSNLTGTYIVLDYMMPSISKAEYLFHATKSDYYINSYFVARRNWECIFDPTYVSNLLKVKSTDAYKNYGYSLLMYDNEWYEGKGYVKTSLQVPEHSFNDSYSTESSNFKGISEEWFTYLYKIIKCCKESNVDITLVCAPLSEYLLLSYENYDEYHNLIKRIADEEKVEFWDFNLSKEDYVPIDSSYYKDSAHLNMYGSEIISELMANLINKQIDFENISYKSVSEKLDRLKPDVCGIVSNGTNRKIISNHPEKFEYRVSTVDSDGNVTVIQEYSNNDIFEINEGKNGIIKINARTIDNPDNVIDISFLY